MKAANIDIIKKMLVKARKKLTTARTNFDNDQYDDVLGHFIELCSKEVENIGQLKLFKESESD